MKLSKRAGDIIKFPTPEVMEKPEETGRGGEEITSLQQTKQSKREAFMKMTVDHLSTIIEKYENKEMSAVEFANRLTYLAAETQEELFEDEPMET